MQGWRVADIREGVRGRRSLPRSLSPIAFLIEVV